MWLLYEAISGNQAKQVVPVALVEVVQVVLP